MRFSLPLRAAAIALTAAFVLCAQNPPLILQAPQAPDPPRPQQQQQQQPAQQAPNPNAPPNRLATSQGFMLPGNSLTEMIDILAKMLKIKYILDPRVKGSVTLYTYGEVKDVELMPLLQTILRVNGAAMVLVGDLYHIVPINTISNLPLTPMMNARSKDAAGRRADGHEFDLPEVHDWRRDGQAAQAFLRRRRGQFRVRAGQSSDPAGQRRSMKRTMDMIWRCSTRTVRRAAGAPLRCRKQPALRPGQRAGDGFQGLRAFGKELGREIHPGGPDQHADRGRHQSRRFRRRGEMDREARHPCEDHGRGATIMCTA